MPKHLIQVEVDTPFDINDKALKAFKAVLGRGREDLFGPGTDLGEVSFKSDRELKTSRLSNRLMGALTGFAALGLVTTDNHVGIIADQLDRLSFLPQGWAIPMAVIAVGAELVAIGFATDKAADPLRNTVAWAGDLAGKTFADTVRTFRRDKEEARIKEGFHRIVVSRNAAFSDAVSEAFAAAGVVSSLSGTHDQKVFSGDARKMTPVLDRLLTDPKWDGLDVSVVSPRALERNAPTVIRRMEDGTSVGLWVAKDGSPIGARGYAEDGSPQWVYSHSSQRLTRTPAVMARLKNLEETVADMRTAVAGAAIGHNELHAKILASVNPLTHTVSEKSGITFVRDLNGKLDNPNGQPACLSQDGRTIWALAGERMSRQTYDARSAAHLAARNKESSHEPPEVDVIISRMK